MTPSSTLETAKVIRLDPPRKPRRWYEVGVLIKLLRPRADLAFTLLRVVAGLLLSFHGMQKILGILSPMQPPVGSQLWIGGVIELACGLLVAAGAFTSWAAFLASGTMAVAYTQFHWKLAFDSAFFPAINKGELALIFAFVFLYIACRGPGPHSLDAKLRKTS